MSPEAALTPGSPPALREAQITMGAGPGHPWVSMSLPASEEDSEASSSRGPQEGLGDT